MEKKDISVEVKNPNQNEPDVEVESVEDIISKLAEQEVYRLQRNLGALDALEAMLMENIKEQLRVLGKVDNETLFEAMKAFNNSVKRSNDIIKGNTSNNLIQVLVDTRTSNEEERIENIKQEESQQEMIPLDGRKRLTSLLAAVINDTEDNEDDDDV
jgi:hypothetical protein